MFYKVIKGILNLFLRIIFRFEVNGIQNVHPSDKFIICSNHASNWDPLFISIIFPRQISWMAKKELFANKILSFLILKLGSFPVARGDTDISAIKNSLRVLKNNGVLGIFPEGTRVKGFDIKNAKPGVALLTIKSKSNVVPIYIESNYKVFGKVKINIGKPIDFFVSDGKKLSNDDYSEISENILKSIYRLKLEG